ncbi:ectoine synthase [Halopseudomonas pachastrellae]|nr:ectoine synthase [Halopseudomonas pachastrellae]
MIVRTLEECENSERRVATETWESTRMLLKDDQMGFSFHITTIYANKETHIHYKNHLESVYCMSGNGEIETLSDGKVYQIRPGTLYILDKARRAHAAWRYRGHENGLCIQPALSGKEVHDKDGVYPVDNS